MSRNVSEEILKDDLITLSSAMILTAFSSSDENFFLITDLGFLIILWLHIELTQPINCMLIFP